MIIAQSGGPSMVINQSLVGAVLEARKSAGIGKILGARHGILGILGNDYVDLRKPSERKLEAIAETPSSALGSCRRKPDAARIVAEEAEKENYRLVVYHIPKTIDNDLRSCDHTPGISWLSHHGRSERADRIDYIYSAGPLEAVESEVVNADYRGPLDFRGTVFNPYPSDHGFVLTKFRPVSRWGKGGCLPSNSNLRASAPLREIKKPARQTRQENPVP